jgi:hypothetical protein
MQGYSQFPDRFHKIGTLEWQEGLQHVTHTKKEKLSNFICKCRGCLVSLVAAATSISICPNAGSDI